MPARPLNVGPLSGGIRATLNMISFACPQCGKQHTARDLNAGRRGFCDCGAVMVVPGTGVTEQNETPKLIGHIDLHSAERHARYMKIGGAAIGTVVILVVVCALYFHNKWERDNRAQLLALKAQADALIQAKEHEKAKSKYDELFDLLGDRDVTDSQLKSEIESARLAATENNKKVDVILAARAAEQEKQRRIAQANALATSQLPREGQINWAIVEKARRSWRDGNFRTADRAEQAAAILVIQLGVEKAVSDPIDREATLDYIQRNIDSW